MFYIYIIVFNSHSNPVGGNLQLLPFLFCGRTTCYYYTIPPWVLQEKCKFQFRPHILGYIQRGGKPSAFDRSYGYLAGLKIVNLIHNNEYGFSLGLEGIELVKKEFELTIK